MHDAPAGSNVRRIAQFLMVPVLIALIMIGGSLPAMRAPQPHNADIAVVGASPDHLAQIGAFQESVAGKFQLVFLDDAQAARDAIIDQEVGAALILAPVAGDIDAGNHFSSVPAVAEADRGSAAVAYVATAAGSTRASSSVLPLRNLALELGVPLEVRDLKALDAGDSAGVGMMFFALAVTLAGFLGVNTIASAAPGLLNVRTLGVLLPVFGALISGIAYLLAHVVLGTVHGSFALIFVTGVLTLTATGFGAAVLSKLIGRLSILVMMLLFLALGMPASGAGTPIEFTPWLYRFLHEVLPFPASFQALRSIAGFDNAGLWGYWLVLIIWIVVGAALLAWLAKRQAQTGAQSAAAAHDEPVAMAAV